MWLDGSCHCGAVTFRVDSPHPYPFNLCYCSICRKTAGGGGYAINLGARAATLEVEGGAAVRTYRARMPDPEGQGTVRSPAERNFCAHCGSALWAWDPRWPDLVHPFASAIDTELPQAPERTHLMLDSRASWVPVRGGEMDRQYAAYPEESIAEWHQRLGLADKD